MALKHSPAPSQPSVPCCKLREELLLLWDSHFSSLMACALKKICVAPRPLPGCSSVLSCHHGHIQQLILLHKSSIRKLSHAHAQGVVRVQLRSVRPSTARCACAGGDSSRPCLALGCRAGLAALRFANCDETLLTSSPRPARASGKRQQRLAWRPGSGASRFQLAFFSGPWSSVLVRPGKPRTESGSGEQGSLTEGGASAQWRGSPRR